MHFKSLDFFILQIHAELLTKFSGTMVGKCYLMVSEHGSVSLSSFKMLCMCKYVTNITYRLSL